MSKLLITQDFKYLQAIPLQHDRGGRGRAHSLDMSVVAEGVEDESQRDFLLKYNCDQIQGYYYTRLYPWKSLKTLRAQSQQPVTQEDIIESLVAKPHRFDWQPLPLMV